MKLKKCLMMLLACTVLVSSLSNSTLATSIPPISDSENLNIPSITIDGMVRSIDTTFTLDFKKSTMWTIDFNNAVFILNHLKVTMKYISCTPANSNASVTAELYIDDDLDGVYDKCDPDGGYLTTIKVGAKYSFNLPYGTAVKNYRIVFVNKTSSVTSGEFSVVSG